MRHRLPGHLSAAAHLSQFADMFAYMRGPDRVVGRRTRPLGWVGPHQGKQEIARRARQIAKGQLTASNGLVQS